MPAQAVLLEEDIVRLSDLRAEVSAEGHQGGNIIREYDDGMQLRMHRPLLDRQNKFPGISVRLLHPPTHAAASQAMHSTAGG